MKEAEGYPNTYFSIYSNGLTFTAQLSPRTEDVEVLVILGPKAGRVIGTITDGATGEPINAGVRIWRWTDGNEFLQSSSSAQLQLLIPPSTGIGLEIRAPGYDPWRYPGDIGVPQGQPLMLKPEETVNLNVKLNPTKR